MLSMLTEAKAIVKTPVTQPDAASKLVASTIARPVRISNTFAVLEDDRDDAACEFVQSAAVVAQPNSATESARTTRPESGKVVQATPQKNQIEKPMGWLDCKIPSCNERCDEKAIQYHGLVFEFERAFREWCGKVVRACGQSCCEPLPRSTRLCGTIFGCRRKFIKFYGFEIDSD